MNPLHPISRAAFCTLSRLGRGFGGVRPRRIYHWLARYGFPELRGEDFHWYRDPWGNELRLNPFYQVDRDIIAFGSYDQPLHAILEQRVRPGAICMDVGAHIGSVSVHLARCIGPTGRVYAFEPSPLVFERLRENIQRNQLESRVEINRLALGSSSGKINFMFAEANSVNQGIGSIVGEPRGRLIRQVEVPTETLDLFVKMRGIQKVDLIKVDIQGAECSFLRGAQHTLAEFEPDVLLEVSPEDLNLAGHDTRVLFSQLDELGYSVYEIAGCRIGKQLDLRDIAPDYFAENVLCTKKKCNGSV